MDNLSLEQSLVATGVGSPSLDSSSALRAGKECLPTHIHISPTDIHSRSIDEGMCRQMVEFQSFRNLEGVSWEYVQVPIHLSVASDNQLSVSSSSLF